MSAARESKLLFKCKSLMQQFRHFYLHVQIHTWLKLRERLNLEMRDDLRLKLTNLQPNITVLALQLIKHILLINDSK
ncbi:hypothetical protein T03_15615 [Trichinella britovi]|uniref:SCAN domain-containing protein 3 n=1 Tax=Trichinella britovi TaxID=45882 RepID=A0A0V1DEI3_TRIBR|nr:hypothetical protein T03_15615 [Trichinella britovi]